MPEKKGAHKKAYPVKKPAKDIYEGIESHYESERGEDREGGPEAPMKDLTGPIVLSSTTYVEEDTAWEGEKRLSPAGRKKKYPRAGRSKRQ